MAKYVRSEEQKAEARALARQRLADARAIGVVYIGVFLQPEVAAFIDRVKKARGFRKRDEVINCLFRDYLMIDHLHLAQNEPGLPRYQAPKSEPGETS